MSDSTFVTERSTLVSYLDGQRAHITGILEGLGDEDLRRPFLQSGWNCLGMVHHLTFDVERFWFRCILGGSQSEFEELHALGNAWEVEPQLSAESVLAGYQEEIERSNAIIKNVDLDAAPGFWPDDIFGNWRLQTSRQVMLHVITETACHAGHLDVRRELIDGRQWMVE